MTIPAWDRSIKNRLPVRQLKSGPGGATNTVTLGLTATKERLWETLPHSRLTNFGSGSSAR